MNVEPQRGVTWESDIANSKQRRYSHTKTGDLRKNLKTLSNSGDPVYRHDQQGFCYYQNGFLRGCYNTLQELGDQIRILYQQGGTRRKIHKQKRRITKKRRITRRTRK
jgi:hypothetical protein